MAEESHDRGAELIRDAFERARRKGNPEWRSMTVAVLKNRLLDLTGRAFDEAKWDAGSFRDFLAQFGDVVEVDTSIHPPQVRLLEADGSADARPVTQTRRSLPELGPHRRIRRDLWEAILDYGGTRYVWDGRHAVPLRDGAPEKDAMQLPSLTREEFKAWRTEFVQRQCKKDSAVGPRLFDWLEREQPLTALPPTLRIAWVIELKNEVLGRLDEWFRAKGEPLPPGAIVGDEPAEERETAGGLRERILSAVRKMNQDELEALQLPARVLLGDDE